MIHYSVSDSIAEIRIDHPPVNGRLGVVMIDDLIAALGRAAAAADVRVVLITSAVPRRFCAGLDLKVVLNDVSALRSLQAFPDRRLLMDRCQRKPRSLSAACQLNFRGSA
jgi:enoyl-CoA hydratase/carnithine racemase